MRRRIALLAWLAGAGLACGGSNGRGTGGVGGGAAGRGAGGAGLGGGSQPGTAGAGGSSVGAGGSVAGSAGSVAGAGGREDRDGGGGSGTSGTHGVADAAVVVDAAKSDAAALNPARDRCRRRGRSPARRKSSPRTTTISFVGAEGRRSNQLLGQRYGRLLPWFGPIRTLAGDPRQGAAQSGAAGGVERSLTTRRRLLLRLWRRPGRSGELLERCRVEEHGEPG